MEIQHSNESQVNADIPGIFPKKSKHKELRACKQRVKLVTMSFDMMAIPSCSIIMMNRLAGWLVAPRCLSALYRSYARAIGHAKRPSVVFFIDCSNPAGQKKQAVRNSPGERSEHATTGEQRQREPGKLQAGGKVY